MVATETEHDISERKTKVLKRVVMSLVIIIRKKSSHVSPSVAMTIKGILLFCKILYNILERVERRI